MPVGKGGHNGDGLVVNVNLADAFRFATDFSSSGLNHFSRPGKNKSARRPVTIAIRLKKERQARL